MMTRTFQAEERHGSAEERIQLLESQLDERTSELQRVGGTTCGKENDVYLTLVILLSAMLCVVCIFQDDHVYVTYTFSHRINLVMFNLL